MSNLMGLPANLQCLVEKRELDDRREGDRRHAGLPGRAPSGSGERRVKRDRRQTARRKGDRAKLKKRPGRC